MGPPYNRFRTSSPPDQLPIAGARMKYAFAILALALGIAAAHAEALTSGAAGRDDADACANAKTKVGRMIEEKGGTAGKFSECACESKNAVTVVCKITGYYAAEGKPQTESR